MDGDLNPNHANWSELLEALPHILAAPKDNVPVEMLCLRPDFGQRNFVDEITMTAAGGIPGERWSTTPWVKLDDGSPDPRIQVSILGKRVLDLVWRDRENAPHPGDTMIADLDFSEENLPEGQLLSVGSVVLRVSTLFNDACVKWKVRYGAPAKQFITEPEHVKYRLRGVLCEIVQDGTIRNGDILKKV